GLTFSTFEEAREFIFHYTTQTKIEIILINTLKSKTDGSYLKAAFACKKQGKYVGKKAEYMTTHTGCPFVIRVSYRASSKRFTITQTNLNHNHDPEGKVIIPTIVETPTETVEPVVEDKKILDEQHSKYFDNRDVQSTSMPPVAEFPIEAPICATEI